MEIKYKIQTRFKTRKKLHSGWKKSQSNGKLLLKRMSSSYKMEYKTFIEASFTSNIHIRENVFWSSNFWKFVSSFFSDRVKNSSIIWSLWFCFAFLERRRSNKYCYVGCVFAYFCDRRKNHFQLWFRSSLKKL